MAKNNDLLSQLLSATVVNSLASNTGSNNKDVTSVLSSALPSLLSGAMAQNNNAKTSNSFLNALTNHGQKEESSLLDNIDLVDGGKIVAHLLGANTEKEVENTAKETGVSSDLVSKIISAAAPVLMAYLGKQVLSSISTNTASETKPTAKKKTTAKKTTTKKKTAAKTTTTTKKKTSTKKKKEDEDLTSQLLTSAASSLLSNVDVGSILTSLLK